MTSRSQALFSRHDKGGQPSPPARMTADVFITWAIERPEGDHYELAAGKVVAMAPSGPPTRWSRPASGGRSTPRSPPPAFAARPTRTVWRCG